MQDYQAQLQTITLQTVKQVTENIIQKVCRQMFYYGNQTSKIFESIVQNKSDIERLVRQKNFMNSLYSSKVSYQEPRLSPIKMLSPLKKKQDKQEFEELQQKAKMFVNKIRNRKKELEGKFYLLKRAEAEKKKQLERKKQVEAEIQKQLQKKIRRLKAQKNIEFFNQKKMVSLRESNSFSPHRRRLSQISESIQQQNYNQSFKLPIISSKLTQIKQQDGDNVPIGLKKTVRKKSIKKRANTQLSSRPDSPNPSNQVYEANEVKLFHQKKPGRIQSRSMIKQRQNSSIYYQSQNLNEKKLYLMKRRKTQDISQFLEMHTNIGDLLKSQKHFSQRNNKSKKSIRDRNNKKYLTKSSLYYSTQLQRQRTVKFGQYQQQQMMENDD